MGKADFGTVDGTIASGFDDGEQRTQVGVQDDLFDGFLKDLSISWSTIVGWMEIP